MSGEMVIYNKLVRDHIPAYILEKTGIVPETRRLEPDELKLMVLEKMTEEQTELKAAKTREQKLEELSDLLQTFVDYAKLEEFTLAEVEAARIVKEEKLGGFLGGVFLISGPPKDP